MTSNYRSLAEHELAELNPSALISYVHAARGAGDADGATRALQLFVWSCEDIVRGMVAKKVPPQHVDDASAHCLEELARAVVRNPPEAVNEKHARGWIAVVVRNQITAWWRTQGKHAGHWSLDALAEPEDAGGGWEIATTERGYEAAAYLEIIENTYSKLSDQHQRIVELRLFEDLSSDAVAQILLAERGETVKPNTIDQVASRFRKNCQAAAE